MIIIWRKFREKRTYRRCWIGVLTGICLTVAIILAGVLPALIVTLTRSSTMAASASDGNGNTNAGQYLSVPIYPLNDDEILLGTTSVGTGNGTTITNNPATSTLSVG